MSGPRRVTGAVGVVYGGTRFRNSATFNPARRVLRTRRITAGVPPDTANSGDLNAGLPIKKAALVIPSEVQSLLF